jgi:hypothetical protein
VTDAAAKGRRGALAAETFLRTGAPEPRRMAKSGLSGSTARLDEAAFATENVRVQGAALTALLRTLAADAGRAMESRAALDTLRCERHDPIGIEIRRALTAPIEDSAQAAPMTACGLAHAQEDLMLARLREARLDTPTPRPAQKESHGSSASPRPRAASNSVRAPRRRTRCASKRC